MATHCPLACLCSNPGTPLNAERRIWDPNWPKTNPQPVALPFELEMRQRAIEIMNPTPHKEFYLALPESDFYFSTLPFNIFQSSVHAIDLLTERFNEAALESDTRVALPYRGSVVSGQPLHPEQTAQNVLSRTSDTYETDRQKGSTRVTPSPASTGEESLPRPNLRNPEERQRELDRLEGFLSKNPDATIKRAARFIPCSEGFISKQEVWKQHLSQKQARKGNKPRTRNTKTGKMESAGVYNDPSEPAEIKESLEPYFLANASPEEKAQYNNQSALEQPATLLCFISEKCTSVINEYKKRGERASGDAVQCRLDKKDYHGLVRLIKKFDEWMQDRSKTEIHDEVVDDVRERSRRS